MVDTTPHVGSSKRLPRDARAKFWTVSDFWRCSAAIINKWNDCFKINTPSVCQINNRIRLNIWESHTRAISKVTIDL